MALRLRRLGQRFTTRARAKALPAGDPAIRWYWAVQERQVRRRHLSAGSTGAWDTESMAPKYLRRAHFIQGLLQHDAIDKLVSIL